MTGDALHDELMVLQATLNAPMGVSCVRSICDYLRVRDFQGARNVARGECDKISQYPEIVILLHENLTDLGCYYTFAKRDLERKRYGKPL